MAQAKKEVAVKEASKPLAVVDELYAQYAGAGQENVTAEDMLIPELRVLQKMSPQVDAEDGAYIAGAQPGMFFDTVSKKLFNGAEGVSILPCYFSKHFIEFIPREKGGGFVADHGSSEGNLPATEKNDKGRTVRVDNGNEIVETHQYAALVVDKDGTFVPTLLRFTSTKIPASKLLTTLINRHTIDVGGQLRVMASWAFLYQLKTVRKENDKGTFYGVNVEQGEELRVAHPEQFAGIWGACVALHKAMKDGAAKVAGFGGEDDIPFN